jgi:protein phosphatase
MLLTFPELSLVLLVGPSGCGKSTFARRHFRPTEIVSSDHYRGVVCDDEANQEASKDAFDLLHQVVARRLEWMRFTVVDATNLLPESRRPLLELAKRYHYLTGAILFDLPEEVCQQQNLLRQGRTVPSRVINNHVRLLQSALPALEREVHRYYVLHSLEQIANVQVRRVPLWVDRREETGPFDIIGDVHGCLDELLSLLAVLDYHIGYQTAWQGIPEPVIIPPPGRKLVFVGDLGDRGPDTPGVYRLVMRLVASNQALCVLGNHDSKLLRRLRGNLIRPSHGLQQTLEQLEREPPALTSQIRDFLDHRPNHYVLDGGRLVVAHAGLPEDLQGRSSSKVHSFALFGDTTGKLDEDGLPVRLNWAADYKGRALVVYGHTPQAEPQWLNNTINIDTGCVFGHRLTALRYPERELVSVPALRTYAKPARDFLQPSSSEAIVEEE